MSSRTNRIQPDDPGSGLPFAGAWDRAYAEQGRLWGGAPFTVPVVPVDARVLELGCGNGKMTAALAARAKDVIALDSSVHACRLARKLSGKLPAVAILMADARSIPLPAGSVDAVVACHVTGHLVQKGRVQLMKEAVRVLKRTGHLLFCDFSVEDFRAGSGTEVEHNTYLRGSGIITHYFTEEEVRSLSAQLRVGEIATRRWQLRIRGRDLTRAEVTALLIKD